MKLAEENKIPKAVLCIVAMMLSYWIIGFAGSTTRLNSDSVTKPSFSAAAFLAGTVDNLPPAIGSSRLAARLERLRLMAQLYVGYGSDIERDRKSYTEVVVFASYVPSLWTLAPNDWANGRQSAVVVGSRLSLADIASNGTSSSIVESISS